VEKEGDRRVNVTPRRGIDWNLSDAIASVEALTRLVNANDRLYAERSNAGKIAIDAALLAQKELNHMTQSASKEAVTTAMTAAEKATAAAFASAEKAVQKAEVAQTAYNERSNEFRAALDDAQKLMISRPEFTQTIAGVQEKIELTRRELLELREWRSNTVGSVSALREGKVDTSTSTALWISVAAVGVSILAFVFGYLINQSP